MYCFSSSASLGCGVDEGGCTHAAVKPSHQLTENEESTEGGKNGPRGQGICRHLDYVPKYSLEPKIGEIVCLRLESAFV